jgi:hypothetical protein
MKTLCIVILNKNVNFFTKSENRRAQQVLSRGWYQWEKVGCVESGRCRSVNIIQILCAHICKWKTRPFETIPEMIEGR